MDQLPQWATELSTPASYEAEGGSLHVPDSGTRAQVRALLAFGHTDTEVANYLRIRIGKFRAMYRDEIRFATIDANSSVAASLWREARLGNVRAMQFWLRNRDPEKWNHDRKPMDPMVGNTNPNAGPTVNITLVQKSSDRISEDGMTVIEGTATRIRLKTPALPGPKDG